MNKGKVISLETRRRERAVDDAIVGVVKARTRWLISLQDALRKMEYQEAARRG